MILPITSAQTASALPPPGTGLEAVCRSANGIPSLAAVIAIESSIASKQPTERSCHRAMAPCVRGVFACARDRPLSDIEFHTLMRAISTVPDSIYKPNV